MRTWCLGDGPPFALPVEVVGDDTFASHSSSVEGGVFESHCSDAVCGKTIAMVFDVVGSPHGS